MVAHHLTIFSPRLAIGSCNPQSYSLLCHDDVTTPCTEECADGDLVSQDLNVNNRYVA